MTTKGINKEKFNADDFVAFLLQEGVKVPCDETATSFKDNEVLPPFYDKYLFRKGQKFFHDNIFALFYCKFLGLLSVLAMPSIVQILSFTKMSGTPMTAYKRYLSTIFHMYIWYESDLTPGSKLWQSIVEVKNKHNSASKKCCSAGMKRINQKDMALTQFGFMGYALAKREKVGLHNVKDEDLQAFVHIWRVIGYIMGVEDRFNICRESVEETTAICRALADHVFRPAVDRKDKDFIEMATYLTRGMWAMNPTLEINVYLNLVYRLLQTPNNDNNNTVKEYYVPLNIFQRIVLNILLFTIWSLQFAPFKFYHNGMQHLTMWLMNNFPFLAYYEYGYANSHVRVLANTKNM